MWMIGANRKGTFQNNDKRDKIFNPLFLMLFINLFVDQICSLLKVY